MGLIEMGSLYDLCWFLQARFGSTSVCRYRSGQQGEGVMAGMRPERTRRGDDYVAASEVRDLVARGAVTVSRRLAAGDMILVGDAVKLTRASASTIYAWIRRGRAIGIRQGSLGIRMPRWQFEPRLWSALHTLATELDTTDGWALLQFLESPHGALEGRTPRQAIEQGAIGSVMEFARHDGN